MSAPTAAQITTAYLGTDHGWTPEQIEQAFNAELAAQRAACRVPTLEATPWPDDLLEALGRRIVHNLALRSLPLGVQAVTTDLGGAGGIRVGGLDAEVRRLEGPYRRLSVG